MPPTAPPPQTTITLGAKPLGRSLIGGMPVGLVEKAGRGVPVQPADAKFYAIDPASGRELATLYLAAGPDDVEAAGWAAWQAFHAMAKKPAADRAALLERIADRIVDLGEKLLGLAAEETGLGPSRLVSERDRTVQTLRMFAAAVREGSWVEATIDTGQPSRRPVAKPDVRRMLKPLGPVAVFGAGNFPLAYSTAGGDTASALAAGCPVIVKGHPAHPGTGELVAQLVALSVAETGFDAGMFAFLHSGGPREIGIGQALVKHPAVRAVGFTGSVQGGMAIVKATQDRPDPIPVFAEMGSTNPVFVLPGACEAQATEIAQRLAASAMNSTGQMCTCPGLVFVSKGVHAEELLGELAKAFDAAVAQGSSATMLYPKILTNYGRRIAEVGGVVGVELRAGAPTPQGKAGGAGIEPSVLGVWQPGQPVRCSPALYRLPLEVFRRTPTLHEEVFGPCLLVVVCEKPQDLVDAAAAVQGSLTGTIWAGAVDENLAIAVQAVLEQRVGRLIFNGVPTGVEVVASMVHGGPFPATNQPQSTAVGVHAMGRWCRPICYQNAPEAMLPEELRSSNPLKIRRCVNGAWVTSA